MADFDSQQSALSAWCESCKSGTHQTTVSLKLEDFVALRGKTLGSWIRGKVTKKVSDRCNDPCPAPLGASPSCAVLFRLVEVFYVDTGAVDYADVGTICAVTPPMLCDVPTQALQCSLSGVKLVRSCHSFPSPPFPRVLVLMMQIFVRRSDVHYVEYFEF